MGGGNSGGSPSHANSGMMMDFGAGAGNSYGL
jgi:hypothetical protein